MATTATERLYLTSDRSRVVPKGDREAAYLWKAEGDQITADEARQYGLEGADEAPRGRSGPPRRGAAQPRRNAESVSEDEAASEFDDGSDSSTSDEGEKAKPADEDKAEEQGGDKSVRRGANKSA